MKGKQKCWCMLYIARFRYDMASSILLLIVLIAEMRSCSMFIIVLNLDFRYIHHQLVFIVYIIISQKCIKLFILFWLGYITLFSSWCRV